MPPRPPFPDWQPYDAQGRRKYLTGQERDRFLKEACQLPAERQAFCHVLAYTGCRVSEAVILHLRQIDTDGQAITFRTLKRRKEVYRTVPVPPQLVARLLALPRAPCGHLWRMHRATAWDFVKATMERAGIAGPMASPKGLRHGFGIRAASKDVPVNLIQRWMGHASPLMTAVYLDAVGLEERQFASRMW